ncbi:MAG: dipeptidase [Clostridiales bacterium]|nr:dipeptidase [Candidatus Crickella merdequi]
MRYIDLHCDTLHKLYYGDYEDSANCLAHNSGHLAIDRMAGYDAQFFACHVDVGEPARLTHYEDVLGMCSILRAAEGPDFAWAGSYSDLCANREAGKVSGFLTVEEGGVLEGDIERLEELYSEGVRLITLTWNYDNCIGAPNGSFDGLKRFGFEAVERMNDLGIIVDVSHLSDKGFWDVASIARRPWMASHSNARSLCDHRRNLTDEMIRAIAENGGVVGLNFYSQFVSRGAEMTRLSDLVAHAKHIINVGGSEVLALGSDFDGIDCELELGGCQDMWRLCEALSGAGLSAASVEAVCWRNAEKYIREVL